MNRLYLSIGFYLENLQEALNEEIRKARLNSQDN